MRNFKNIFLPIGTLTALAMIGTFINARSSTIQAASGGPSVTIDPTQLPLPVQVTSTVNLTKPSNSIVAIEGNGTSCSVGGAQIDQMIGPDGVPMPFLIPAGFAFMVTGVDFANGNFAGGVPAGDRIGFVLRAGGSGIVIAEGYEVNTGLAGSLSGHVTLSTPMRITSTLCMDRSVGSVIGGTRAWIRGFLVKDS